MRRSLCHLTKASSCWKERGGCRRQSSGPTTPAGRPPPPTAQLSPLMPTILWPATSRSRLVCHPMVFLSTDMTARRFQPWRELSCILEHIRRGQPGASGGCPSWRGPVVILWMWLLQCSGHVVRYVWEALLWELCHRRRRGLHLRQRPVHLSGANWIRHVYQVSTCVLSMTELCV